MMKYRGMDCEILGGPGKYYWQISGIVNDMPYSENAPGTITNTIACAAACKKAVDLALEPPKDPAEAKKKKRKKSGPPVVAGKE